MTEWQRLTPEGTEGSFGYFTFYENNADQIHTIGLGYLEDGKLVQRWWDRNERVHYQLSTPELDALIRISGRWREMPEVKALVEDLKEAQHICEYRVELAQEHYGPFAGAQWVAKADQFAKTLAAVEAPND